MKPFLKANGIENTTEIIEKEKVEEKEKAFETNSNKLENASNEETDVKGEPEESAEIFEKNIENEIAYMQNYRNELKEKTKFPESQNNVQNMVHATQAKKRNLLPLWILGWVCFFPIPLTILLARSKMKPLVKFGIIIIMWLIIFNIGLGFSNETQKENTTSDTTIETTITPDNKKKTKEKKTEKTVSKKNSK